MKTTTYSAMLATALLATHASAATILLQDNFDSYADQAAFAAAWTANATMPTLSTAQAVSPTNSVQGLTTATRAYRQFTETTPAANNFIEFSFQFYDSLSTAAAYRQYAEIDDGLTPGSNGQIIAMGLNNNIASTFYMARILGVDGGSGASAFFRLDGVGAPARSTGWHELKALIKPGTVDFYVDGIFAKSVSGVTLRSYETVKVGSNLSAGQTAYFDNVLVAVVPEPTSLAIAGMVAPLLFRRR